MSIASIKARLTRVVKKLDVEIDAEDYALAVCKLRINVKSLAYEAKCIRKEAKGKYPIVASSLHYHRVVNVREEARASQLALAAIRNKRTYRQIERKCEKPFPTFRIEKKIKSVCYGSLRDRSLRWSEAASKELNQ